MSAIGEERPPKTQRKNVTINQNSIIDTHQWQPNDEWCVDIEECLDIFNMDVKEEFGDVEADDQVGESSTRPKKS